MDKKNWLFVILAIVLSSFVFLGSTKTYTNPTEIYHVYLKGKSLGYIESKKELEDYINEQEYKIKEKFNVEKVYSPNDLDVVKEITYDGKISTIKSIYNKIKEISPFTIKGYTVNIDGVKRTDDIRGDYITDSSTIYVLNKEIFEEALKQTLFVFVSEDNYKAFINDTQIEIQDTGKIIEDIFIKNNITIKESNLSVEDKIFTDSSNLSKYLLFGTLDSQKTYTVKAGETIESIAYNNKMSINEFLIANEEFNSADNLLFQGQKVTLGTVKTLLDVVEEDHIVSVETSKYKTEIVYDNTMLAGYEKVKQNGKNGTMKVTKKVQYINGELISAVVTKSEEVTPTVNKVIVRGSGSISVGNLGTWAWPTKIPYVISSGFGYRWGTIHEGIDITGTGYGSPIYAANDGVVHESGYTGTNGNYIIINHNNGYYTIYAHMSKLLVGKGDIVSIGQQIGKMGSTGYSTGTHLHFGVSRGYPISFSGNLFNPLRLYE